MEPENITDFTKFKTGLGQLFEILQNASDKNKMESVLKKDPAFKKIDRETAAAINLFAGMNLKVNEKDEMCIRDSFCTIEYFVAKLISSPATIFLHLKYKHNTSAR